MLDEPSPHIKTYDSPTVRQWEAWKSLHTDLDEVFQRTAIFVAKSDDKGWTMPEAASLWDSALVKLFRHYGNSPLPDIRQAYDRTAERLGLEWEFAYWRKQRDKKIAHPVGHEEFWQVRVYLTDSGVLDTIKFGGGWLLPVADTVAQVMGFAGDMRDVEVAPQLKALQAAIEREIGGLSESRLSGLRQYFVHAHGRRFGA